MLLSVHYFYNLALFVHDRYQDRHNVLYTMKAQAHLKVALLKQIWEGSACMLPL